MPENSRWGPHRIIRILSAVPLLAALVTTAIAPAFWPAIPITLFFAAAVNRNELRLTDDELIYRHLIGTTRIPRSEIASARFDYKPFGVYLDVHRKNGQVDHLPLQPKASSSELSGDPPQPDSAAYQVTRWAERSGS